VVITGKATLAGPVAAERVSTWYYEGSGPEGLPNAVGLNTWLACRRLKLPRAALRHKAVLSKGQGLCEEDILGTRL
jgi:hypothetical protein